MSCYTKIGYDAGRAGTVARPSYDPRDPLTMVFLNDYDRSYDAGAKARVQDLPKPPVIIGPVCPGIGDKRF